MYTLFRLVITANTMDIFERFKSRRTTCPGQRKGDCRQSREGGVFCQRQTLGELGTLKEATVCTAVVCCVCLSLLWYLRVALEFSKGGKYLPLKLKYGKECPPRRTLEGCAST